jgi:hypothetical protein
MNRNLADSAWIFKGAQIDPLLGETRRADSRSSGWTKLAGRLPACCVLATFAVFVVSGKHQHKAHSICAL